MRFLNLFGPRRITVKPPRLIKYRGQTLHRSSTPRSKTTGKKMNFKKIKILKLRFVFLLIKSLSYYLSNFQLICVKNSEHWFTPGMQSKVNATRKRNSNNTAHILHLKNYWQNIPLLLKKYWMTAPNILSIPFSQNKEEYGAGIWHTSQNQW